MEPSSTHPDPPANSSTAIPRWPFYLFILSLVYAAWTCSVGLTHNVGDFHGFRQAQTAITIDWMVRGPLKVNYETPVLGPPWSIPYEFPVYQWIVAVVVRASGLSIDVAGRLIAFACFLGCFVPVYTCLGLLNIRRDRRWLVLLLISTSPMYLFWSRTVLVESLALLAAITCLTASWAFVRSGRMGTGSIALIAGITASLSKTTTFVPIATVLLVVAGWYLISLFRSRQIHGPSRGVALRSVAVVGVALLSLLAGVAWRAHADDLKCANVLAATTTADAPAMQKWTYGTAAQRNAPESWGAFKNHTDRLTWPGGAYCIGAVVVFAMLKRSRGMWASLGCIGVGLIGPLIFTNLYVVHEYYWYANGMFFVVAIGLALVEWMKHSTGNVMAPVVIVAIVVGNIFTSFYTYLNLQRADNTQLTTNAATIAGLTSADEVLVFTGFEWSSELPYYAGRRALMIPNWPELDRDMLLRAIANLRDSGLKVGALVYGPPAKFEKDSIARDLSAAGVPARQEIELTVLRSH